MNKPNSVQWFLDKLIEHRIIIVDQTTYGDKVKPKHEILLEQAKAMHKEEMKDFYFKGWHRFKGNRDEDFDEYYNETFEQ